MLAFWKLPALAGVWWELYHAVWTWGSSLSASSPSLTLGRLLFFCLIWARIRSWHLLIPALLKILLGAVVTWEIQVNSTHSEVPKKAQPTLSFFNPADMGHSVLILWFHHLLIQYVQDPVLICSWKQDWQERTEGIKADMLSEMLVRVQDVLKEAEGVSASCSASFCLIASWWNV